MLNFIVFRYKIQASHLTGDLQPSLATWEYEAVLCEINKFLKPCLKASNVVAHHTDMRNLLRSILFCKLASPSNAPIISATG
jgi:hypothetical protein